MCFLLRKDTITATCGTAWFGISRRRERFKIFQNREIFIVALSNDDLAAIATRANLVQLLRQRYERVRLDLSGARMPVNEVLECVG